MTREEKLEEIRIRREVLGETRVAGIRSFTVLFWWVLFGFALLYILTWSAMRQGDTDQKGIGHQRVQNPRELPMSDRVKEAPKGSGM